MNTANSTPKLTKAQQALLDKVAQGRIRRNWLATTWRDLSNGHKAVNYNTYVKIVGAGLVDKVRRGDWEYLVIRTS